MVCDIGFIVITRNILRSVNDIPIVKPGISLYRRSLHWRSAHTFYYNICWVDEYGSLSREYRYTEDRYTGVLPIHFTITFAGQTNMDR